MIVVKPVTEAWLLPKKKAMNTILPDMPLPMGLPSDIFHWSFPLSERMGELHTREINAERDLNDLICAAISPVRPFGYVHAYTAGSQKSIKGHFSLFIIDQSHIGGALHKYQSTGAGKNIIVVLCGRMTP